MNYFSVPGNFPLLPMGLKTNMIVGTATIVAMASVPLMNTVDLSVPSEGGEAAVEAPLEQKGSTGSQPSDPHPCDATNTNVYPSECCAIDPDSLGCKMTEEPTCNRQQENEDGQEHCCSVHIESLGCRVHSKNQNSARGGTPHINCDQEQTEVGNIEFCCAQDVASMGCIGPKG